MTLLRQRNRNGSALTTTIPAPTGGLNARDPLPAMPPLDASSLTNLFPDQTTLSTRKGNAVHATHSALGIAGEYAGLSFLAVYAAGAAETLLCGYTYSATSGGTQVRCRISTVADNGTITSLREISSGANTITSIGEWCLHTSASGTTYWVLCASIGGTFTPQGYDGSVGSALSITGCPANTLGCHSHRNRLWFYNGDTKPLSVFYLPAGSITGAVIEYNLGVFATKGGRIVSMRTWAQDGGDGGSDDVAVFYTSEGQVLVFAGTDPSSTSTWQLIGVFQIGRPTSRRGSNITPSNWGNYKDSYAIKHGSDVLFLAEDGLTSATRALRPVGGAQDYSISDKIRPLLSYSSQTIVDVGTTLANWKMAIAPALRHLVVNRVNLIITSVLPGPGDTSVTVFTSDWFVMNIETGAWTKFEMGYATKDFVVYKGFIYGITGGVTGAVGPSATYDITKYGVATDDLGTAITYSGLQAYNYLNSPDNKLCTLARPQLLAGGTAGFAVGSDFVVPSTPGTSTYAGASILVTPGKYGRAFAGYLYGTGAQTWYSTSWAAQPGGFL